MRAGNGESGVRRVVWGWERGAAKGAYVIC